MPIWSAELETERPRSGEAHGNCPAEITAVFWRGCTRCLMVHALTKMLSERPVVSRRSFFRALERNGLQNSSASARVGYRADEVTHLTVMSALGTRMPLGDG